MRGGKLKVEPDPIDEHLLAGDVIVAILEEVGNSHSSTGNGGAANPSKSARKYALGRIFDISVGC